MFMWEVCIGVLVFLCTVSVSSVHEMFSDQAAYIYALPNGLTQSEKERKTERKRKEKYNA